MIWTRSFWKGAGERSLKTFLQCFAAVLLVNNVVPTQVTVQDFMGMPWLTALVTGVVGALFSLMTSVRNVGFVSGEPNGYPVTHD